jgi:hypothetical protein
MCMKRWAELKFSSKLSHSNQMENSWEHSFSFQIWNLPSLAIKKKYLKIANLWKLNSCENENEKEIKLCNCYNHVIT